MKIHRFGLLPIMWMLAACSSAPEKPEQASASKEAPYLEEAPYAGPSTEPDVVGYDAPYAGKDTEPDVVAYEDFDDPLAWFNKPVFKFNNALYLYGLSPLSKGYKNVLPTPVRSSVSRFFLNLREPISLINHLLQGEFKNSGKNLARFGINSTLGLLGLFDVSDQAFSLSPVATDFNSTFTRWGIGYGAYLVLPVLGPSDLRDGPSLLFDRFAHPLTYIDDQATANTATIFDGFQRRAPTLAEYPDLIAEVDDPYIFVRNLYLQNMLRDEQYKVEPRNQLETSND